MRLSERPTEVPCQEPIEGGTCGVMIPVGTRGPIPSRCSEHRANKRTPLSDSGPNITLRRSEVDELRQAREDLIAQAKVLRENYERECAQHWETKEVLRDERLKLGELERANVQLLAQLAVAATKPGDTLTFKMPDEQREAVLQEIAAGSSNDEAVRRREPVDPDVDDSLAGPPPAANPPTVINDFVGPTFEQPKPAPRYVEPDGRPISERPPEGFAP